VHPVYPPAGPPHDRAVTLVVALVVVVAVCVGWIARDVLGGRAFPVRPAPVARPAP